jgi:hypothetical protein
MQSLPDLADDGVDAGVDVDKYILAPQPIDDLAACDELTSALHQQDQQLHRVPFDADRTALATQLVRGDVKLEIAEAERAGEIGGRHWSTGGHRTVPQVNVHVPLAPSGKLQISFSSGPWLNDAGCIRFAPEGGSHAKTIQSQNRRNRVQSTAGGRSRHRRFNSACAVGAPARFRDRFDWPLLESDTER